MEGGLLVLFLSLDLSITPGIFSTDALERICYKNVIYNSFGTSATQKQTFKVTNSVLDKTK